LLHVCSMFARARTRQFPGLAQTARPDAAAAILYTVGGLLLTMLVNVPINDQLAATAIPPSVDEARAVWVNYSGRWQTYNQLRTAACGLSLLLAAVALRLLGPSGSHRHGPTRSARDDSE
ncbi:MAG: anthrone oxygenase family protein, partial [Trebonia sp.]